MGLYADKAKEYDQANNGILSNTLQPNIKNNLVVKAGSDAIYRFGTAGAYALDNPDKVVKSITLGSSECIKNPADCLSDFANKQWASFDSASGDLLRKHYNQDDVNYLYGKDMSSEINAVSLARIGSVVLETIPYAKGAKELAALGKSQLPVVGKTTGYVQQESTLFNELTGRGVKFTRDSVVRISKLSDGRIVFLEMGNSKAGLTHILENHGEDFLKKGISEKQLPDLLMKSLETNKIVGYQGKGQGRTIYEVNYQGRQYHIAITVGSNGFIVGANPTKVGSK